LSEGFLAFPAPGGLGAGSLVAGFRLEEPVGAGGMAVVYRARDERLGRLVALKVLAPALAADEEFRRRFTAESRAAAAVDHPHIIPVYEAGEAGGVLFIAMRFVTGGDLRKILAREGPLPPGRAAQVLSPVASALDTAHRAGLVHRDVKPANILVDAQPDRPDHIYLSDFGISKGAASSAGLTGTGQYLGTPEYTSPEQVKGLAVDGRADQYALACVAWHLLTGSVPFQRDQGLAVLLAHLTEPPPLTTLRPGLPAATGQVLARAMAKEPGERYPSCGEFADSLRDALALPPYRPAAAPAVAGHPRTEISAPPGHPATVTAGTASVLGGPAPEPVTPASVADRPTEDIATPNLRPWHRSAPDSRPVHSVRRRRRYLVITLLAAAAAAAIPLLLFIPSAPKSKGGPHDTPAATSAASGGRTEPSTPSGPPMGTLTTTLTAPASHGVQALAFAPGGTTLAIGDLNGSTYLWNTATGKVTATLTDLARAVQAVAFAPGGTTLAIGDLNGSTYLWNTATRKVTATLTDPASQAVVPTVETLPGSQAVFAVAFAPGGTTLAVGDWNGSTYLWNTATRKVTATLIDPGSEGVKTVAFAPGGTTLAVGDLNGSTYLWNTATGQVTATLTDPAGQGVNTVAFSPGGDLAVGDANGSTYLWNTATPQVTATLTDPASRDVNTVAFSPGGNLAVGDANGSTYLWNTATGKVTATLTDPASRGVFAVAFAPGGTTLAVGDNNGSICLWRISKRSP
jgi:serine/threonine protein kinase